MTATHTIIIQVVLGLIQLGNAMTNVVPDKWKPVVLGVVALAQIVQARLAHNSNPDGTPASVAYVAKLLLLCLLLGSTAGAQTPAPADATTMFSVQSKALNLHLAGQNNPGTDLSGSYTFLTSGNKSWQAVTDNLLVPGINYQGYYAGAELQWKADSLFSKTTLPKNSIQLYGAAEGGFARNVPPTGAAISKPSFYGHGGINYDPTHKGKFTLNLFDAGFVYATNLHYPNPETNGYTLSVGIKLGLWTKN